MRRLVLFWLFLQLIRASKTAVFSPMDLTVTKLEKFIKRGPTLLLIYPEDESDEKTLKSLIREFGTQLKLLNIENDEDGSGGKLCNQLKIKGPLPQLLMWTKGQETRQPSVYKNGKKNLKTDEIIKYLKKNKFALPLLATPPVSTMVKKWQAHEIKNKTDFVNWCFKQVNGQSKPTTETLPACIILARGSKDHAWEPIKMALAKYKPVHQIYSFMWYNAMGADGAKLTAALQFPDHVGRILPTMIVFDPNSEEPVFSFFGSNQYSSGGKSCDDDTIAEIINFFHAFDHPLEHLVLDRQKKQGKEGKDKKKKQGKAQQAKAEL